MTEEKGTLFGKKKSWSCDPARHEGKGDSCLWVQQLLLHDSFRKAYYRKANPLLLIRNIERT